MNSFVSKNSEHYAVINSNLESFNNDATQMEQCAIIMCTSGSCNVKINLVNFTLQPNATLMFVPNDIVETYDISSDFDATVVTVSSELVGEACSRFGHYVFEVLHSNRFSQVDPGKIHFVKNIFENIRMFYEDVDCSYRYEQGLCQLRSLFCWAADLIKRGAGIDKEKNFTRMEEHFRRFMKYLTERYKQSREVSYYANEMNITPKYLNFIVQSVSKRTCKNLIDAYVIMQLKTEFRSSQKSIQEIAYEYNFPNQSFLGFYFKKYAGVSPRNFRKKEDQ